MYDVNKRIGTGIEDILEVIVVNNQLDAHFFFMYVYLYSLHVSGSHVPIIRRINCINTTSGICHTLYRWPFGLQLAAH